MSKKRKNEGSIRKRADGRFEVRIQTDVDYDTGSPIRKSMYATSEQEAKQLLHQLLTDPTLMKKLDADCTLTEWLENWLKTYVAGSVKQSTFNSYRTYVRNHFAPVLGKCKLSDLTPRKLQEFYNFKQKNGKLSPKTIINMNLCLHKALDQTVKEGLLKNNPASALNLRRGQKPQIEILTRDQQIRLLQESKKHRYGVFIRLTLATGLRIGELVALRWDDIDFQAGTLHVRRTLGRLTKMDDHAKNSKTELVISDTKSGNSTRSIPLLRGALEDLVAWRAIQERDKKRISTEAFAHPEIVVTNKIGQYVEPRTFFDHYQAMLKAANLPHFTFHALRHTFATRALEQGMDAKTLSSILGHYSVSFTLDTYTHVLDEQKRQEMNRMEELFDIPSQSDTYPALLTTTIEQMYVSFPDFPKIKVSAENIEVCIRELTHRLKDEISLTVYPPEPSDPTKVEKKAGQIVVMLEA